MNLTEEEYQNFLATCARSQRLHHILQRKLVEKGVEPIDVLLASLQATQAYGSMVLGGVIPSFEWIRTAIDTWERQYLADLK